MNKNTRPASIIDQIMDEYIMWGGPVVTRKVAYNDMKDRGFDSREIDISVFGRKSVPAPSDPAAHLDFFRHIQAMGL